MPRATGRRGGRAYYAARHKPAIAHRDALVLLLRSKHQGLFPAGVRVGVDLYFYVAGASGDGDNMEKLVLDALQQAGVLANDKQVRSMRWCWATLAESGRREQGTTLEVWAL